MASVLCIADDGEWWDAIKASAGEALDRIAWSDFDHSPIEHGNPNSIALAQLVGGTAKIDQRLGSLCRSFPGGVIVELDPSSTISDEYFFAHGYRKLSFENRTDLPRALNDKLSTSGIRCFEYRLSDYKAVPDWLNARFWAHPERFHL